MKAVRYGMIGGGQGAFIGGVHRTAAAIAGNWQLVAGAFSSTPEKSRASGAQIGVAADRTYGSWVEMLEREKALPDDQRIEVVAIVTPNHMHAPPAIAALEAGFDVIIDKPLADTLANAQAIADAAARTGRKIAVTHTYTGYPLVKQARAMVASGELGAIRRVMVKYTQDWLSRPDDLIGNKQAEWRVDPARSGEAGAFGDIGTHAANLVEFITGERITAICAELAMLPGRRIDDDGAALFRLSGGGRGTLTASQICVGDANDLAISVYGEQASLHWRQEQPNSLTVGRRDQPTQTWHAGANRAYLPAALQAIQRTPGGHPEGYLEAFANIYAAFGRSIRGIASEDGEPGFATMADAIAGMTFIRASLDSSSKGAVWVDLSTII
ncbi:MAG: Gfo/Idh/MocA family oxidoreductase [Sphingobium sp.]|uniref:Gfo/Idh/MocA family protein n=1 Tax=Sphingobium sp. TaxID=1912891 RepID=UPI001A2935CE|nr:Gfo/Idh/MocA family oxidoreductase [Sphingobium sp.]MBJ7443022.1 Gfo/Idh/MocA family oxidoreductase [Sphingobium sp.]